MSNEKDIAYVDSVEDLNAHDQDQRRRASRRQSSFLRKRSHSFIRSPVEIADVLDDGDDEEIRDIKRAFSSIEGNAGDEEEIESQVAAIPEEQAVFNDDDNKVRRASFWFRLARACSARMHWICLVSFSLAILCTICILERFGTKFERFARLNIPLWALFSIPTLMAVIFLVVAALHFVLDKVFNLFLKKSHWILRLVVRETLNRFKVVTAFLLCEVLIVGVLLHHICHVPKADLSLAYSICRASYILSLVLCIRSILVEFARNRVSRHLFKAATSDLSFAKDMLVLLCVFNDHEERESIRQKWADNMRRNEYNMQLQRTAASVLQLPLKIVDRDGGRVWEYSPDTMIEIASSHQMRLVAGGLRDVVFQSTEKLSFARIRTMLCLNENDTERCFETLFKRAEGDYSSITSEEFFVCIQTLYTDRADLYHKLESYFNAADIAETALNAFFVVLCTLVLFWAFGFPMNSIVLALPAILPTIAFAISQSVTDLVESVVFVTIRRPFGIGDRVQIEGEDYIAVRISMMTSDFVGNDHKLVTISNSALSKMPIFNHRRAGPAVIRFKANIAYTTAPEKLEQLRQMMMGYVVDRPDSWKPDVAMLLDGLDDGSSLCITFKFYHRLAWHESILPQAKTEVIQHLRLAMMSLDISGSEPVAWVNVDASGKPV